MMLDLAELYRRHRAYVRASLLACRVPPAAVDDALQDVFLVLFRRADDYDASRGTMRAWLFGISLRVARRYRRQSDHAEAIPEQLAADDAVADPESYASRLQAADLADRILDRLPRDQLSVLVLGEIEQLSGPEIARTLQLELGTVYSRLSRARKRLRREVRDYRREQRLETTPWLAALFADLRRALVPADPGLHAAAFVSVRVLRMLMVFAGLAAALAVVLVLRPAAGDDPPQTSTPRSAAPAPLAPDRWRDGLPGSDQQRIGQRTTSVAGVVTQRGAGPIHGAEVCAWLESDLVAGDGHAPSCTRTDRRGHYELGRLLGSRYRITATAPRMRPGQHAPADDRRMLSLRIGERREGVDIALEPGGVELRGHVADVIGGSVDGATVMVRGVRPGMALGADTWGAWPPVATRSDAEGRFSVWVREGDLEVLAAAEGYARARTRAVAPGLTVELVLSPESTVSGRVIDRVSGDAIARAQVVIDQDGRGAQEHHVTYADSEGRFRFAGLLPGRYKPRATAPGRMGDAGVSFDLGPGESRDQVVIEMVAAPTITGRIVIDEDESPCPTGVVALQAKTQGASQVAMTDTEGRVVFEAIMPGTYEVLAACQDHASPGERPPLEIGAADQLDLRWSVSRGRSIRGRVVDATGQPVAEAYLAAYAAGPSASRMPMSATTGADGVFTLRGATPGSYSVQVSHDRLGNAPKTPVTVTTDDDPDPLELVLPASGRIEGRLVDEDGAPQAGITVQLTETHWARTLTRDDGRFVFEGLIPERYVVSVPRDAKELARTIVTLEADGIPSLELTIPARAGKISGVVVDEDGGPVRDAIITALPDVAERGPHSRSALRAAADFGRGRAPVLTDDDGRFTVAVTPGRPYTVLAQRRGGGDALASAVAEGSEVRLRIAPLGTLAGRVLDPAGKPADALLVTARNVDTGEIRRESFLFDDGGFRFESLVAGHYELVAQATQGRLRHEVDLRAGEGVEDLDLRLVGGVTVRGQVVDLHSGAPISGMIVIAGAEDADVQEFSEKMQQAFAFAPKGHRTDAQGRFELRDVPPEVFRLAVLSEKIGEDAYGGALFITARAGVQAEVDLPPVVVATMRGGKDIRHDAPGFGFDQDQTPWCTDTTIAAVQPDSPAARAGLRVGDVITTVDGHDVTGPRCHLALRLAHVAPGTKATLTLARGDTVVLTPSTAPTVGESP